MEKLEKASKKTNKKGKAQERATSPPPPPPPWPRPLTPAHAPAADPAPDPHPLRALADQQASRRSPSCRACRQDVRQWGRTRTARRPQY